MRRHSLRELASLSGSAVSMLPVLVAAGITFGSCSPAFWNGVAAGLAAQDQASYYSPQSEAQEEVCVKYQTTTGWSRGYSVEGTVIKGTELNRRTGTYNYDSFATYVVVFWAPGEASVLRLDSYFGSIPVYGIGATDQRGHRWSVAKTSYCY